MYNEIKNIIQEVSAKVGSTFGPFGGVVLIRNGKSVILTKDGRTVLDNIKIADDAGDSILTLIRDVAARTVRNVGDGTTTATLLINALWEEYGKIHPDANRHLLAKGSSDMAETIASELLKMAVFPSSKNQLIKLATTSANGDTVLGTAIGELVWKVGGKGTILFEKGQDAETTTEARRGYNLDASVYKLQFINNEETNSMRHSNPLIAVITQAIDNWDLLIPVMTAWQKRVQEDGLMRPLVLMVNEMKGSAISNIMQHSAKSNNQIAVLRLPVLGENQEFVLQDLREITGATIFSEARGKSLLKKGGVSGFGPADFGECDNIVSDLSKTIIVGGKAVSDAYLAGIDKLMVGEEENGFHSKRKSSLSGGIGIIRMGGKSQAQLVYNYFLADDAARACLSAMNDGMVAGGGRALIWAAAKAINQKGWKSLLESTDAYHEGARAVITACDYPASVLLKSIIRSEEEVRKYVVAMANTVNPRSGFDIRTMEMIDMFDAGIVDAAQSPITALQAAVSVCGVLINTKHFI